MRLTELEPVFQRHESRVGTWTRRNPDGSEEQVTGPQDYYVRVATLAEAQGMRFLCPLCFAKNGGKVGTHAISIGFAGRCPPGTFSRNKEGADTRWSVAGSGVDDLTLQPSIQVDGDSTCTWHGFVTNGEAT